MKTYALIRNGQIADTRRMPDDFDPATVAHKLDWRPIVQDESEPVYDDTMQEAVPTRVVETDRVLVTKQIRDLPYSGRLRRAVNGRRSRYVAEGCTEDALIVALWEKTMENRPEAADAIQAKRVAIKAAIPIPEPPPKPPPVEPEETPVEL